MIETGLPTTLKVDGEEKLIHTDFRYIINILCAFNDPELSNQDKMFVMLEMLYDDDWTEFNDIQEAAERASWFIDCGAQHSDEERSSGQKLMDWEQDYSVIIPPINRIAGREVRTDEHLHWWTFMGYYKEIGECFFSQIIGVRDKLNKGEKLEPWEKKFLRENREQVMLKNRLSADEQAEIDELFGGE